jgi:hypothetical protein
MTLVACHQPNFAPWAGFFSKMKRADVFVLLDDIHPPKGVGRHSVVHRTRVADRTGVFWLTLPVKKSEGQTIREMKIDSSQLARWSKKCVRSLTQCYARSPYVAEGLQPVEEVLNRNLDSLFELNLALINVLSAALEIKTPIVKSSDLDIHSASSMRLAEITRAVGGQTYLSGNGASDYLDESVFTERGVSLAYHKFVQTEYPQFNSSAFIPGLSVIDMICNIGLAGARSIVSGDF